MAKKKSSNMRGSREHGRGRKKGRGAGLRGGRGNAGSFGHKIIHFRKKYGERYFGKHGFKRPQKVVSEAKVVNVGDLERLLPTFEDQGLVSVDGDVAVVDLDQGGYDKLLGGGNVRMSFRVKVAQATDSAQEKLSAEGGSVEIIAPPEPEAAPGDEEDDDGA